MSGRSGSTHRRSAPAGGIRAAVILASTLALIAFAPAPSVTDATWTDSEHTSGSFSAFRLGPPQVTAVTACVRPSILEPTVLAVQWRWPAGLAPYSDLDESNALWAVGDAAAQTVPTTGPVNGVYTTTFSGTLLGNLLGSLLGSSYEVNATTAWSPGGGQTWTSPAVSTVSVSVPLLAGAPTCTVTNGS